MQIPPRGARGVADCSEVTQRWLAFIKCVCSIHLLYAHFKYVHKKTLSVNASPKKVFRLTLLKSELVHGLNTKCKVNLKQTLWVKWLKWEQIDQWGVINEYTKPRVTQYVFSSLTVAVQVWRSGVRSHGKNTSHYSHAWTVWSTLQSRRPEEDRQWRIITQLYITVLTNK